MKGDYNMNNLTPEQQALVDEIMKREDPQRRVDDIVKKTKKALKIWRHESVQTKVDKIVKRELKKLEKQEGTKKKKKK